MKNIFALLLTLFFYNQAYSSNNTITFNPELIKIDLNEKISGKVLCVVNHGYARKTIYLWYKNEVISKISVGGDGKGCFEIGGNEYAFQWKASEGMNGSKKGFYSGEATFY